MNRYEKYKDSGIAWIGEIPEHWEASPIKHICINDRYAVKTGPFGTQLKGDDLLEEGDVRVYNQKNVIYNFFDSVKYYVTKAKADTLKSFYTRPYDFLITSRGTIGRSAILPENAKMGLLHPCLIALRIDKRQANTSFLQYYINDTDCFKTDIQLKSNATTIEVIYTEPLKGVVFPLPTIDEQVKIAEYLDWKCGEVDKIVTAREEQIKLLSELRTSIISRAVTKGLNPDAPLKDSGIPWIGSFPAHWNIIKVKHISKVINGSTPNTSNEDYWDGEFTWITPADMKTKYIANSNRSISKEGLESCGTSLVSTNSIIISSRAPVGKVAIATKELCTNQGCKSLTAIKGEPIYLYYFFVCNKEELENRGSGTTFLELSTSSLQNFEIITPPLAEQQAIADYLDKKTAKIDSAVAKYKEQIAKLKEYRQALITEVVTGKIDVRDVIIPKRS